MYYTQNIYLQFNTYVYCAIRRFGHRSFVGCFTSLFQWKIRIKLWNRRGLLQDAFTRVHLTLTRFVQGLITVVWNNLHYILKYWISEGLKILYFTYISIWIDCYYWKCHLRKKKTIGVWSFLSVILFIFLWILGGLFPFKELKRCMTGWSRLEF